MADDSASDGVQRRTRPGLGWMLGLGLDSTGCTDAEQGYGVETTRPELYQSMDDATYPL
jgi:hypothetical protein